MPIRSKIVLLFVVLSAAACTLSPNDAWVAANTKIDENGCYVIERYDSEEDSCYLKCDNLTDAQCNDLALRVYGESDELLSEDNGLGPSDEKPTYNHIATYSVSKTLALSELFNTEPENDEFFQYIWETILAILPNDFLRNEVVEYHINTDGLDNTLAYVSLHETIPEKWVIAIDPDDFTGELDQDFIHTVIHEFAHIVFLNKSQLELDTDQSCSSYSVTEGCSNSASYINAFYSRFWADIIDDNPSALADIDPTDENEITEFYNIYRRHFVNEYAATNPVEDAAEVFAHFVLSKKPPSQHLIAQQKIAFLYQFSELVELRNKIRANMATTVR